jgi:hypothetical protein
MAGEVKGEWPLKDTMDLVFDIGHSNWASEELPHCTPSFCHILSHHSAPLRVDVVNIGSAVDNRRYLSCPTFMPTSNCCSIDPTLGTSTLETSILETFRILAVPRYVPPQLSPSHSAIRFLISINVSILVNFSCCCLCDSSG